jgi:hypothetical protein
MNLRSHSLDKLRQIITTGAFISVDFAAAAAEISYRTVMGLRDRIRTGEI